jgi:hypothetical protein
MRLIITEVSQPEIELEMAIAPPLLRNAIGRFYDKEGNWYERTVQESSREQWFRIDEER